ncbi:MAG: gliding motility-associated C-terminal domain-containing protein [Flavobacteriales bacterium]|jgi:gliding motility-associated-like protein|nr:gliding motility-associated C-terminal domain-containing protein [Flavobacteriales bacterium]
MKSIIAIVSVLLFANLFIGQNLVPNSDFETFTGCPIGPGQITNATGWTNPDTSSADYFHSCNTGGFPLPSLSVPSNIMGYQQARSGNAYGGIICNEVINFPPLPAFEDDYREYLQVQLTAPLVAGTEYEVEFYWSLSNASTHYVEELGAYFSNTFTNLQQSTALSFVPQVSVSGTPLNDTSNWVLFRQSFVASGGEQYMIIGNFNDPNNTTSGTTGVASNIQTGGDHAYYYIEDVSVQEATCFEIEKILVDACGTPEGQNEMVTFRVGSQDLNVADLTVNWPSNSYGGIIQNTQTAQQVATVNSTIQGCGHLIEPTGGVLPAGSEVLLITSYNFDPTAHSFANLNDTLVVIFQNSTATGGHFANYNSSGGTRTLSMSFSNPSGCSDVVSYERDQLVNQNGTTGGSSADRDGAFVVFSADGTPTYDNLGCQVPAGILSIDISSNVNSVCGGETIDLTATVEGDYQSIVWNSSEGTFSSQGTTTTTMTVSNSVSSAFYIYGGVVSSCNDTIYDSLLININGTPNVSINVSDDTLCTGQNVVLTASGASSYVWNGGVSTNNPLTITSGGNYTVVGTSGCGTDSATVIIYEMAAPQPVSVPSPLNSCDSNEVHSVDLTSHVCESCTYTWSDGSNGQTYTGNTPNFSVSIQNYCGTETVNYNYNVVTVSADIFVQDSIGDSPFEVAFTSNSQGVAYTWDFDNGNNSSLENPTETFLLPGEYNVLLTVTEQGCTAMATQTIIVNGELPTAAVIPNVFTPNGDGVNEVFKIATINGKDLRGAIFNRWGRKVTELNGLSATWDGGNHNSGTYYYVIEVDYVNDSTQTYEGAIQLIK